MPRTRPPRPRAGWRSLSAVGAVLGLALPVASGAGEPQFANQLFKDRNTVERKADERIGRDYACAVVTRPTRERRRTLLIYVTSKVAAERARDLRSELERPRRARVRVISKRFRARRMLKVEALVKAYQPHSVEATAISLESPLNRSRCPRVEITLLPKGEASTDMEQWAATMRTRYGADRVVVRRADLQLR